jgi:hypothetical protein
LFLDQLTARWKPKKRLEAQQKALTESKSNYWATEVEIQRIAAAAWIAKGKGRPDEALRLMRARQTSKTATRSTSSRRDD